MLTSCRVIVLFIHAVLVHKPWPMPYVFVPRESTVELNCTAQWVIDLANDTTDFPLPFNLIQEELSAHGVYELPMIETPGMPPTQRLLINDTERNNQTVIRCVRSVAVFSATTLFIHGNLLQYMHL